MNTHHHSSLGITAATAILWSLAAIHPALAAVTCPAGSQPFHIVFKETFKFHAPPLPPARRFYSFDGCKREAATTCSGGAINCSTTFDITAQISFGEETSSNPLTSDPVPIVPAQNRPFEGTLVQTKFAPHGDLTQLISSDLAVDVHGNWFYNKNLMMSFEGATLPVGIGPISAGFPMQ
jgi:hypothetical protein